MSYVLVVVFSLVVASMFVRVVAPSVWLVAVTFSLIKIFVLLELSFAFVITHVIRTNDIVSDGMICIFLLILILNLLS